MTKYFYGVALLATHTERLNHPVQLERWVLIDCAIIDNYKMTNQILLVEDNLILQMLGLNQFNALGVGLDVASCGASALEKVKDNDYQLVLMDLGLPKVDGIEAAKNIRKYEKASGRSRLNIVAVTALSERKRALAAGMDDFVQKPLLLNDLVGILQKWAPTVNLNQKAVLKISELENATLLELDKRPAQPRFDVR